MANQEEQQEIASRAREPRKSAEPSLPARADGALEQLREILFGAAQREMDRRLRRIDTHLGAKTHDIEAEVKRRTDLLDAHFRRELDALTARFDAEANESREAIRAMVREQRERLTALEQRLARMEENQTRAHRELRDRILEQAKASLDEVSRVRDELVAMLDRELGPEPGAIDEDDRGAYARPD